MKIKKVTDLQLKDLDTLIKDIKHESEMQIKKFGIQEASPFEWVTWIGEEFGEVCKAIFENITYNDCPPENVYNEAIQLVTLTLKLAEYYRSKISD